jgi:hypothetical protein
MKIVIYFKNLRVILSIGILELYGKKCKELNDPDASELAADSNPGTLTSLSLRFIETRQD